ncbi:hypothetical protein N0V82_003602 [Gnomoniopsis sp. IMI 355080]|nr:hypothetical protein N0V82_003602 [Gnomoniopsis sp. IMI 355080]
MSVLGEPGSPESFGFQMVKSIPRNCTSISPCQQDATLIRDQEIAANIVNECGRTELQGNIDIGENTENALAAQQVTQVRAGGTVTITMHQVNADGAGPFNCDLDPTSNGLALTGQTPLTVMGDNIPGTNGLSQEKERDFNLTVQMPADMKCIGESPSDYKLTGGCIPVQQVDTQPNQNTPQNIQALKTLPDVMSQIAQNTKDFPAAIQAIQNAGSPEAVQAVAVANALTGGLPNANPVKAPPQQVGQQPQVAQPATEPAAQPATEPATQPAAQPATQPQAQPKGKPGQNSQNGQNGQKGAKGN